MNESATESKMTITSKVNILFGLGRYVVTGVWSLVLIGWIFEAVNLNVLIGASLAYLSTFFLVRERKTTLDAVSQTVTIQDRWPLFADSSKHLSFEQIEEILVYPSMMTNDDRCRKDEVLLRLTNKKKIHISLQEGAVPHFVFSGRDTTEAAFSQAMYLQSILKKPIQKTNGFKELVRFFR